MNYNELIESFNSKRAEEIFEELYGEGEIETARCRYSMFLKSMLKDFPQTELPEASCPIRVFSAPGRTELGGNHTDHNLGKVLAASIQMDSAAIVQVRKDNTVFFRSTGYPDVKVKLTDSSGAYNLQPKPEETGKTESLVRGIAAEFIRRGYSVGGFSANADSTVLPGSGLSSSAAVETLLCRIFDSLYNDGNLSPLKIAQISQIAENVYFGKPCGLMDQTACASGGAVAIDFAQADSPAVRQIGFNLAAAGYSLCVVNTGGSHADLTPDYAAIPAEMRMIASFFGKSVLRELDKETVLSNAAELRKVSGDRALLRALHFFDENTRVDAMAFFLTEMEKGKTGSLFNYLDLVNESGDSSWELLQNIYSPKSPESQGITVSLALTRDFFRRQKIKGAYRVHGGGFAGTIQVYLPVDAIEAYRTYIETIFGSGSVTVLHIRPAGAVELVF